MNINHFLFFSSLTSFKEQVTTIDLLLIYLMLLASLIPIVSISKQSHILDRLASASSFGSKLSLIIKIMVLLECIKRGNIQVEFLELI